MRRAFTARFCPLPRPGRRSGRRSPGRANALRCGGTTIRSFADVTHAPAARETTTLRLGAQRQCLRARSGERPERFSPRSACVPRRGTNTRGRTATCRPARGDGHMLAVVLALAGLGVGAALTFAVMRGRGGTAAALQAEAERELTTARREADAIRKEAEVAAKEHMLAARSEAEEQLKGRSVEVARSEERLAARAAQLDQLAADVAGREGRI